MTLGAERLLFPATAAISFLTALGNCFGADLRLPEAADVISFFKGVSIFFGGERFGRLAAAAAISFWTELGSFLGVPLLTLEAAFSAISFFRGVGRVFGDSRVDLADAACLISFFRGVGKALGDLRSGLVATADTSSLFIAVVILLGVGLLPRREASSISCWTAAERAMVGFFLRRIGVAFLPEGVAFFTDDFLADFGVIFATLPPDTLEVFRGDGVANISGSPVKLPSKTVAEGLDCRFLLEDLVAALGSVGAGVTNNSRIPVRVTSMTGVVDFFPLWFLVADFGFDGDGDLKRFGRPVKLSSAREAGGLVFLFGEFLPGLTAATFSPEAGIFGDFLPLVALGDALGVATLGDVLGVTTLGDVLGVAAFGDAFGLADLRDAFGLVPLGDAFGVATFGDLGVATLGDDFGVAAFGVVPLGDDFGVAGLGDFFGLLPFDGVGVLGVLGLADFETGLLAGDLPLPFGLTFSSAS